MTYLISVNPGSLILLETVNFELDTCCDDLCIYDGNSTNATELHCDDGSTSPGTITSSGNQLFVTFESDYADNYPGFLLTYTVKRHQTVVLIRNISVVTCTQHFCASGK